MKVSKNIENLMSSLQILPGVGPKTAKRLSLFLLGENKEGYLWFVRQILYEKIEKSLVDQRLHEKLNEETFNEKDISEIVKRTIKDLR